MHNEAEINETAMAHNLQINNFQTRINGKIFWLLHSLIHSFDTPKNKNKKRYYLLRLTTQTRYIMQVKSSVLINWFLDHCKLKELTFSDQTENSYLSAWNR